MSKWGIKTKLLSLALIPTLALSLLFSAAYLTQRFIRLNDTLSQSAHEILSQLSPAVRYGLTANNKDMLQEMALSSVQNPYIISLVIFDNKGNVQAYSGPESAIPKNLTDYQSNKGANDNLFVSPVYNNVTDNEAKNIIGYIALDYSTDAITVKKLQALVTAIILTVLGAL